MPYPKVVADLCGLKIVKARKNLAFTIFERMLSKVMPKA
jgi:hypothetical protein